MALQRVRRYPLGRFALLFSSLCILLVASLADAATTLGSFGLPTDFPVAGDWRGDGTANIGVFRNGEWRLDVDGNGVMNANDIFITGFGLAGETPVPGDWNGDGTTDVAVFRKGQWRLDRNGDRAWSASDIYYPAFGLASDQPVSGDWDGDGITEIGTFRNGQWRLDVDNNGQMNAGDIYVAAFGKSGDLPVSGDWNGDGVTDIGVFRDGQWRLDTDGNRIWNANDTYIAAFGKKGDLPVCGDWNGDGITDIGYFRDGIWTLENLTVFVNVSRGDTISPDVSISSPASATTFASAQTVTVSVSAQDNVGVSRVELYDGAVLKGTDTAAPFSFSWAIASSDNGSHSLTAKAYDAAGNSKVSAATAVTVAIPVADTTAPTASITSPAAGTTYTSAQTVTISVSAQDNVGVTKVELYDGTTLKGTDTTAPYSFSWAVASADNGSHSLTAKAYDAVGNTKVSAAVGLTVNISAGVYTTPVLEWVQVGGADFLLGWSQPVSSYGIPDGGYDLIIDGVDTASTYRTNQLNAIIGGLVAGQHCFQVEARWTQAVPAEYPRSQQVCATSSVDTTPPPDTGTPPVIPAGPVKVFPGAQGFGSDTPAGRGGQILRVTNLNDSGAGSLRAAVDATGPRTIVFEVSGRINLLSNLTIRNPYVTIAGQTAPAPGIMISGLTFAVTTHDVLVQHLSIRVGDENKVDDSGRTADAIQITGTNAYNILFDHVSASWAIDEIVGIGYGIRDITFSNCLFAEGLNNSVHPKGAHGYGILLGDDSTRISLFGNLLAHAADRLPRVQGGDFLLVNNVFYNKGGTNFSSIGSNAGIATRMSAVGNLFLEGLDGTPGKAIAENSTTTASGSAIYQKDNAYPGGTLFGGSHGVSSPPSAAWISGLTYLTDPLNQVKTSVLKNAGARPAYRDVVDKRIVADVTNRTGRIIDSQIEVGGFPVLAQNKALFNAGTNPSGDDDGNGYTNLEEILYQMALQVEGR